MRKTIDHRSLDALRRHCAWSGKEVERLIELVEIEDVIWRDIADELGRTVWACKERYKLVKQSGVPELTPSRETLLVDRDARHAAIIARNEDAAARGDLTFLIGDLPPPGMSALDKMRARA